MVANALEGRAKRFWGMAWSADGQRIAVARAAITNDIVLFVGLGTPTR